MKRLPLAQHQKHTDMNTKSTFAISFVAQKGKPKADGRIPILARIIVNKAMSHFSTKFHIAPDRWSAKECRTLGMTKEEKEINSVLDDFRALIRQRYNEMVLRGEVVTADKVRQAVLNLDRWSVCLLEHFDRFNDDYKQLVGKDTSYKTYSRYVLTRRKLADFMTEKCKVKDIPLAEVTPKFINDFFIYLRSTENNGHNYHTKFIQRLRTVYNVARNNGWVQTDPFAAFKMHFEKVDRGYLTKAELEVLRTKHLPSARLELVRDIFIFSCYTGISYIDLKELRKCDLAVAEDGRLWIDTERIKTGVRVNVPLLDIPLAILNKYADHSTRDRLLDIPSNQKVNDYLKEIAALCSIDKEITFHLARHTFATTVTLTNGVPIETVSKMLGHTNIRTTQIYARIITQKIGDDMNALAGRLNSGAIQQQASGQ